MPDGDQVQLKTYKLTIACLLEDFVQSNLQFFYVEKFLLEEDTLIYVKSGLMLALYVWYGRQLLMLLIENKHEYSGRSCFVVAQGIIAGIYPISRLFGCVHQMRRKDDKIVGACVRYSYFDRKLMATPFRLECLIGNDYIMLLSSGLTVLGVFGFNIYLSKEPVFRPHGKFATLLFPANNVIKLRMVYATVSS